MIGTLVNAAAVVVGGLLGLLAKKGIKASLSEAAIKALGIGTILIGLSGTLSIMLRVGEDGSLSANGGLLLLIALVLGTLVGEWVGLHDAVENLSGKIAAKLKLSDFSDGFVTASVLFCAGAMAIVGAINDGLYGDASILFVKSAMDGICAVFLASTLGTGVVFSAVTVLIYQGAITLLAGLLSPILTPEIMDAISMTGFAIVAGIGLNLSGATQIKITNMVFALPIVALLQLIPGLGL